MVSCSTIEVQIIFKMIFALIAGQLAIVGQLGGEIQLNCFLEAEENMFKKDDLADKAIKDVFALP